MLQPILVLAVAFCLIIVAYFAFALRGKGRLGRLLARNASVNLTSLGILGTFIGISVGLVQFDAGEMLVSVPELLGGLKFAFFSSILGLLSALVFRLVKTSAAGGSATGAEEIVAAIEGAKDEIKRHGEANNKLLEQIRLALSDESDNSVSGQIQRLRGSIADLEKTTKDGFVEQVKEFKNFAKEISEKLSKSLMEELKNVIREFNEKITEQFGDNFKQLNQAVGKLVIWQENYRQQMDALKTALDDAVSGVSATRQSLEKIENSAAQIPSHTSKIADLMEKIDAQIGDLEKHSSTFADMHDKAVGALPIIEQNLTDMTENMKNAVTRQSESQQKMLEEMETGITASGKRVGEQMTQVGETITNGIHRLDEEMQKETQRVLQAMASELGSIAEKFVSQYEPLMEALRRVVEAGERQNDD